MNYNSNKNQSIKNKLVSREVTCNVSLMCTELMQANQLDSSLGFDIYDYLEPYAYHNDLELTREDAQEEIDSLNQVQDLKIEEGFLCPKESSEIEQQIEELENLEFDNYPEVFEFWAVNPWFAEKLKNKGEVIIEYGYMRIWGRCCTGQAILLDNVISEIASGMQILENQTNDWGVK